ncbi:MFS transporter [Georgenia faecalis]|uniref:MFS transporter n=1 Tax=Georgenia faecalis TaxID=2483799 RepID=A0ABV9D5F4_9MICO|nr:MFS transporter [Georgenia faecalis]
MRSTFHSLKFFNYRLWFAGALVANIGTWMQRVAQDWLVLTVLSDDSGLAVGIVTALQFLPTLLIGPYAGLLADRLPRRKMLIATQSALALLAVGLGVLVLTDVVVLWHVYLFALALGVVTAFDNPVRQTFVAEMVPPSNLPNAVGLNSTSFNAARLIGPGLAGLLIAAFGPGWAFILNGLSFGATIFSLTLMRRNELHELPHSSRAKGQVRAGLAYVRHRSDLVVIMLVMGVVSALGLNFQLTSAVMAREVFDQGAGGYGALGSIMAIGSLAGALMAARRQHPRVRLVITAAFAFGVTSGVMALMPSYELYAASTILVGFSSLTMLTAANTVIQMSTEPAMRGRVMSLYMMVLLGSTPIGAPVVGWVSEVFGARWSIGVGSIAAILVAAGAALWTKRNWHVEVHYEMRPRPHLVVEGPGERHGRARDALGAQSAGQASQTA